MKRILSISLFIALFSTVSGFSQSRHYSSQSLGMGGGGTAYVDGYHANFINPANLMINPTNKRPKRSLGLVGGVGARFGGTLVNLDAYDTYLTQGLVLEGQVASDMLDAFFGGSDLTSDRDVSTTVDIIPFGFSNRGRKSAVSLAIRSRVAMDFTINRGFAELAVYGLDPDQFGASTPVDFSYGGIAYSEISVGYARQILSLPNLLFAKNVKLYAGIAPKYLIGVQHTTLDFNSTLLMQQRQVGGESVTSNITHTFDYSWNTVGALAEDLREFEAAYQQDNSVSLDDYLVNESEYPAVNATGFGFDMGATLEMDISGVPIIDGFFGSKKTLRLSMSLTDLGSMTFDQTPTALTASGEFDFSGQSDEDGDDFFDNLADSLQNDVYGDFDAQNLDPIKYELPAMYNFGASLVMGKLTTSVDFGFGFNDSGTNSKRSALNLGMEYRLLGFIPLRAGTRVGGYSSTVYSFGAGLDLNFLELSAGLSLVGSDQENGGSVASAFSGLMFRF